MFQIITFKIMFVFYTFLHFIQKAAQTDIRGEETVLVQSTGIKLIHSTTQTDRVEEPDDTDDEDGYEDTAEEEPAEDPGDVTWVPDSDDSDDDDDECTSLNET